MQASTVGRAVEPNPPRTTTGRQVQGVAYERIHPSTRRIIETLFPCHTRGVAFLLGLLRNATVMSYVPPGDPGEVREDTAVVSVMQDCDELSQRVDMAYDTTHMYLVIYRALGLLYQEKQGEQTLYRIPLHAYQPPLDLSDRLRQLQEHYLEKRPRVRRLVKQIIERIAPLTPVDAGQPSLIGQSSSHPNPSPSSTELLSRIQRGLLSKGVEDPDGQIAMCVAEVVVRVDQISNQDPSQNTSMGRFAPENLAMPQKESTGGVDSAKPESTPLDGLVASSDRFGPENLPRPQQPDNEGVDSCELAPTALSTDGEPQGRFVSTNLPVPTRENSYEVDSLRTNVTFDQYNIYITQMMTNVTLREHLQRFLAAILDDDETQWRRYNPLFQELSRNPPLEPEAITAALVETLVIRHAYQTLSKPGGYFTKRCRAYCTQIPVHVRDLMKTYGHMTYEALVLSLKTDADQHMSRDCASRRNHTRRGYANAAYGPSAQSKDGSENKQCLAGEQERMSEREAKALKVQIKRESAFVQVRGIRRTSQAAYVLDVSIDGVPWTISSKQEWDRYYADLRACESYSRQVTER